MDSKEFEFSILRIFTLLIFLCVNLQTLRASTTVQKCRQNISDTKFINNGYKGLVVLVGEEVDEDYSLIEDLRKLMTATSERMFQVTRRRAYIRTVSVLLPVSWGTPPPELEDIMKVKIDFVHSSEKSDFRLKNRSPRSENEDVSWALGDEEAQIAVPYVIKPTPCGYSGHYLRLTPEFVRFGSRAAEQIGSPDKLLVREWAKLRWGVYDETPIYDTGSYFYTHTDLNVHPISCSMEIPGEIISTNSEKQRCSPEEALGNSDCRFVPRPSTSASTKKSNSDESKKKNYASLMYRPDLDYVNQFCDTKSESGDDVPIEQQHNPEAPTVHNLHCQGKSVWEVIRNHPDFKNGNNPPLPEEFVPPPIEFNLLQNPDRRIVLVLDISTSMKYFNRMKLMRQAASQFIETVPDNSWIGIVTFAAEGTIMSDLMQVKSNYIRQMLKNRLPNYLVTGTSIGSGIIKGLQVLKNSGPKHMMKSGGSMLVLSDGKEHNGPKINDTLREVLDFGVRVTTIAFGAQVADDIGVLAELTGGSTYFASSGDFSDNSELRNAFLATIENSDDGMVVVSSESFRIKGNASEEHKFIIDETIGRNTRITVLYSEEVPPLVGLRNPVGETLWENEAGNPNITALFSSDENFSTKTVQYSGKMWSGTWSLLVKNKKELTDVTVDVTVFSHPVKKQESLVVSPALLCKVINFTGSESIVIYAHLSLGEYAVLDAQVEAVVTRPLSLTGSYDTATVVLKDDGRGADIIPHDGIYSGYFTMFTLHGHYNVKVNAGDGGTARLDINHILGIGRRKQDLVTVSTKDLLQKSRDGSSREKSRVRRAIKSGLLQPFRRWSTQQKEFLVNEYVAKVCADGYKPFQDSCYKFVRVPLSSYRRAKKYCSEEGGFLAHVNSNQELLYLMESVRNKDAWFGGIDNSLNKDEISVEFVAQRTRRGSAADEDLEAIADLFNLVYVNVDLRKAIESFEPDWEGLSRKEINRIIRNLGVTTTADIARLKEEKLLSQLDLDDRIRTTTNSPREKRQAETPPIAFSETTVYETTEQIVTATTDSPDNENSTLALAKKKPDEFDFMNSGEVDPECSWFNNDKIIETSGEVCTRKKAFLCEKPKLDLYPPSRITDFKVKKTVDEDVVRLVWTATGDDKTNGKATKYEIRALRTGKARSLEKDFKLGDTLRESAILGGTINDPKVSGYKEELLVNMTTLSGCPPHAAIDLTLVIPLRLLTPKMMLASQRDAAMELFRTLFSIFKITEYEVQVTVVAAQNQTARLVLKDSSNAKETMNAIMQGIERDNKRGEEIEEDNLKDILASVNEGGRKGISKVLLSLLAEEDTGTAKVLRNVTGATVIAVGLGIEKQKNIRDVVSHPKCRNAIFAANWLELNQIVGQISDQLCYARRAEYQAWGIIAIDEEGQKSDTSNIASSVITNRRETVLCPPEITEAPLPSIAGIDPTTIGLAVGIPVALLLSIVGAIMLIGQVKKYRKKKQERKERKAREAEEEAAQAQRAEALRKAKFKGNIRTSMSNLLQNPKFKLKINKTTPLSRPPV